MAGRVLELITDGDEGEPDDVEIGGEVDVFEYDRGVVLREEGYIDGE